jgi:hypothetical protein
MCGRNLLMRKSGSMSYFERDRSTVYDNAFPNFHFFIYPYCLVAETKNCRLTNRFVVRMLDFFGSIRALLDRRFFLVRKQQKG